jgi:plastocyanin
MSDATIFYILGGLLAVLAVVTSFIGLRVRSFPGRFGPVVFLAFFVLVVAAITFAIRNGQHEEQVRAAENESAGKEVEEEEENPLPGSEGGSSESAGGEEAAAGGGAAAGEEGGAKPPKGPGGTLTLSASPTAIAYVQKSLTSKPGKVTIDFSNPAAIEHDVAIEGGEGEELAVSELITEGKTSVSADLAPGNYTFFCTVPGHREAGMEGTLTVK